MGGASDKHAHNGYHCLWDMHLKQKHMDLFIYSLTQQIFMECLLSVRSSSRCGDIARTQTDKVPAQHIFDLLTCEDRQQTKWAVTFIMSWNVTNGLWRVKQGGGVERAEDCNLLKQALLKRSCLNKDMKKKKEVWMKYEILILIIHQVRIRWKFSRDNEARYLLVKGISDIVIMYKIICRISV